MIKIKKSQKEIIKKIVITVIFWRALLLFVVLLSSLLIPQNNSDIVPAGISKMLLPFVHWDSKYYLEIIKVGYGSKGSILPVFFPLFPVAVKSLSFTGLNVVLTGLIINFFATLGSVFFLYELALDFFNDKTKSMKTIEIFLFFPTAVFLSIFYSEAIFCFFAFGSFYFARKRNWLLSNILLAFVTASRAAGLVVAISIFIEYLNSKNFKLRNIKADILYFLIAPIGLLIYMLYLNAVFADPFYFKNAYKYGWSERSGFKPNLLETIFSQAKYLINLIIARKDGWLAGIFYGSLGLASWLAALTIILKGIKRIPVSYAFYAILSLFLFISQGVFDSILRYLVGIFPIFIIIAGYFGDNNDDYYYKYYLLSSASFMFLIAILYSNGTWIG